MNQLLRCLVAAIALGVLSAADASAHARRNKTLYCPNAYYLSIEGVMARRLIRQPPCYWIPTSRVSSSHRPKYWCISYRDGRRICYDKWTE